MKDFTVSDLRKALKGIDGKLPIFTADFDYSEWEINGMVKGVEIINRKDMDEWDRVQIKWGEKEGQLTVEEARAHALIILECAEAAESDAFVFKWLTKDILETEGDKKENWNRIIAEFREFREARTWRAK